MDIRQLRYFVAVVDEKTVTAAAARLNMTQPPLTAQLHSLEDELGCRLFRHEGRYLHLTEAGEHLYRRATEILGMCDSAREEIANFRDGLAGTLRIGVVSSVQGPSFATDLRRFHEQHPAVRFSIHSGNTYELLTLLQNNQVDLAMIRTPFDANGLQVLQLENEPIVAIADKNYFDGHADKELSIPELAEFPLILYRRWEKIIRSAFESDGSHPNVLCVNDDAQMTALLAREGVGVGLLPASAVEKTLPANMTVLGIRCDALRSRIALVHSSARALPKPAQLFWEMMKS